MAVPDTHFVNQHRLHRRRFPTAFSARCSGWAVSGGPSEFWSAPGVYITAVGYAGGHTPNATYREVCTG